MITDLGGTAGKNKKDSLITSHYLMKSLITVSISCCLTKHMPYFEPFRDGNTNLWFVT